VLKYLARYTHRIAISNHRILSLTQEEVSFTWKDYRQDHRPRVMTLELVEFARRFLLHVLPHRFVKIRYYGILAQSQRGSTLPQCRELIDTPAQQPNSAPVAVQPPNDASVCELPLCPRCQRGPLRRLHTVPPLDSS
jgi:hypothetical protein